MSRRTNGEDRDLLVLAAFLIVAIVLGLLFLRVEEPASGSSTLDSQSRDSVAFFVYRNRDTLPEGEGVSVAFPKFADRPAVGPTVGLT